MNTNRLSDFKIKDAKVSSLLTTLENVSAIEVHLICTLSERQNLRRYEIIKKHQRNITEAEVHLKCS